MKKLLNLIFISLSVILFSCIDDPVSDSKNCSGGNGACSSHGGVYCAVGADSDGSVICNDGWKDSSVSYCAVCE